MPLTDFHFTIYEEDWLSADPSISGDLLNYTCVDATIAASPAIAGSIPTSVLITTGVTLAAGATISGAVLLEPFKRGWVAWSKIGQISTTIDRTNEAGQRPMDWEGWAYKVLQLGKNAVVYGENGVSLMYPVNAPAVTFGFKNLHPIGLLDNCSVAGSTKVHYFADNSGTLWKISKDGLVELGFKEFLLPLKVNASTRVVFVYDELNKRLLISNGTTGYVLTKDDRLGGGWANIGGVGQSSGSKFYGSPAAITNPDAHIVTDIIDFGYRGYKTITLIEIATATAEELYVAVDYRFKKTESFTTSAWKRTNDQGVVTHPVQGVEFRFRAKQTALDALSIDYINVRYKMSDKRYVRGPLSIGGKA